MQSISSTCTKSAAWTSPRFGNGSRRSKRVYPPEKRHDDDRWAQLEKDVLRLDSEECADEPNDLKTIQVLRPSRRTDEYKKRPGSVRQAQPDGIVNAVICNRCMSRHSSRKKGRHAWMFVAS
jgi:hypothetical protein